MPAGRAPASQPCGRLALTGAQDQLTRVPHTLRRRSLQLSPSLSALSAPSAGRALLADAPARSPLVQATILSLMPPAALSRQLRAAPPARRLAALADWFAAEFSLERPDPRRGGGGEERPAAEGFGSSVLRCASERRGTDEQLAGACLTRACSGAVRAD